MKGWQKDPKGRIKKQNAEEISWFFYILIQFKKGKREEQGIQSSLKGCREKRLFKGHQFKSRPTQILLGNFFANCTILSYFFDSEQLFGEWATLKLAHFWHIFTIFKLHSPIIDISTRFLWKFIRHFTGKFLAFWSVGYRMLIDSKYGCPRCDDISITVGILW